MGTYDDLLACFPMSQIRPEQVQMLKGVADALDEGKKYILIEAPTGCGKSPVAIALCKYFKSGYICTDQKNLQKQYLRDFKGSAVQAIGRSNFVCKQASIGKRPGEEIYCDRGNCTYDNDFKCPGCPIAEDELTLDKTRFAAISDRRGPLVWKEKATAQNKCNYWLHKTKALNSEIVVNNYAYLLTEGNFVRDFGKRNVLISDEGHNIEKHIMSFVTISITEKTLEAFEDVKFPYIVDDVLGTKDQIKHGQEILMPLWINWLRELYMIFPKRIQELEELKSFVYNSKEGMGDKEECPSKIPKSCEGKTKDEILEILVKMIETLESLSWTISFFLGDCSKNPGNWIIQPEQEGPKIIKGEFKPVRIDKYAKEKYFRFGETNIIMSATILDFECMAKDLGILPEEYAAIKIPPVFSKESNELYHLQICDLSYENTREDKDYEKNMLLAVKTIDILLDKFSDHKGIIHCNTYQNMAFIKKHSKHADRILGHTRENREAVLKKHVENIIPSVLCSPSMTEGVDLKFDTSRFQIIIKVPYPYLGDIQIKERSIQDPQFYINRTALYLVQAIGRSVRDKDDWAYTYTIDSRFPRFCHSNSDVMENFNRHERSILDVRDILAQVWK